MSSSSWLYSPVWALAAAKTFFQSSLIPSSPRFNKNFLWSSSTPSIHLNFGLPILLLPSGLSRVSFFVGLSSSILIIWPAQCSLAIFIYFTMSQSVNNEYNSLLYLIRQVPFSFTGPNIFLRTFLSKILSSSSLLFVSVQHSLPYVRTDLKRVLYMVSLVLRFRYCDFNILL